MTLYWGFHPMQQSSTWDINDTYEGITVQWDISVTRHCWHLLDFATLVAVDIMSRDIMTGDIAPPHQFYSTGHVITIVNYDCKTFIV